MKYCEEYAALLDLFADGELPPDEMERVRAHLETCPGCRAYVDDALAIRAGFADIEDTAVPEGFAGSVMERIREDAGRGAKPAELRHRSARRWAGIAALAACCALVILLRSGYGGGTGKSIAAGGAGAPAEASAACDTAGGEEEGASSRMKEAPEAEAAPPAVPDPDAAASEEELKRTAGQAETQMAAGSEDTVNHDFAADRALPAEPGGPAPYTASASLPESVEAAADAGEAERTLRLTADEAGDLLDGREPVWKNAEERCYVLSAEEYRALLAALGRPDEAEGETFTVLVTQTPGE